MRHIFEAVFIALIVIALCSPVDSKAGQVQQTSQVYGVAKIKQLPWWVDTIRSIKVQGGFKIGDIWRRPETTKNLSVRSSIRTSKTTRMKVGIGDHSHVEGIYYMQGNREYFIKQTIDDSLIGWRVRW